nr:hypothetical protein Ade03nite_14750 [Actinoplanes derwentensis]
MLLFQRCRRVARDLGSVWFSGFEIADSMGRLLLLRLALVDAGSVTPVVRVPADLEAIRAAVARSRAEQGLPPKIEDAEVLGRMAVLFKLVDEPATRVRARRESGIRSAA